MKNAPAHARGFTLIELIIGTAIATVLTAAAFAFAAHETRLMGVSRERVELVQAGRASLDLIAEDLAQAGAGVGYGNANPNQIELDPANPCPGGTQCFRGLIRGRFTIRNVDFNQSGFGGAPQTFQQPDGAGTTGVAGEEFQFAGVGHGNAVLPNYFITSQAFAVRMANGSFASIVNLEGGTPEHCLDDPNIGVQTQFADGELVVLRHQDGLMAQSALMSLGGAGPCVTPYAAACANNCTQFNVLPDPENTFAADNDLTGVSYRGGEIQGGLKTVAWFIAPNAQTNSGTLSRAVFDSANCAGAAPNIATCAGAVAEYAEFLAIRVWAWDTVPAVPTWRYVPDGPIPTNQRLRVDIELILRSRRADVKPRAANILQLSTQCVPTCGTVDHGDRRAYRTTVEITNSGRIAGTN